LTGGGGRKKLQGDVLEGVSAEWDLGQVEGGNEPEGVPTWAAGKKVRQKQQKQVKGDPGVYG